MLVKDLMPYCHPWFEHWQKLVDPEGRPWKDDYFAKGMINRLSKDRERLWECLSPLPRAERLFEQLCEIIDAVGADTGLYFLIQRPYPASDGELIGWVREGLARRRELTGEPETLPEISVKQCADPRYTTEEGDVPELWHDFQDWIGDSGTEHCTIEEHAAMYALGEALYTMACDDELAGFVEWVFAEDQFPGINPFRFQFDLWRSGADIRMTDERSLTVLAPHRRDDRCTD